MAQMNTIELLEAGLKTEFLRQKALASNVANMNSPGYRSLDVKFEEVLTKALETGEEVTPEKLNNSLYTPKTTKVKPNGNDVNLEAEVGKMVRNNLRHTTYIRLLRKKYEHMNKAMEIK